MDYTFLGWPLHFFSAHFRSLKRHPRILELLFFVNVFNLLVHFLLGFIPVLAVMSALIDDCAKCVLGRRFIYRTSRSVLFLGLFVLDVYLLLLSFHIVCLICLDL